jgi:diadenylate cyclase
MNHRPLIADTPDFLQELSRFRDYSPWKVGIELLLIGTVVYMVLRFLQGTRGARLMKAVGLIIGCSFLVVRLVAVRFELDRINVIFPYFISGVFLIALVVFQTELRRGLMRLGQGFGLNSARRDVERMVDSVATAAARLSKKKIGAIIAIEHNVPLGGVIASGCGMDAEPSADLIETIFWPASPLHDMGMVVKEGRISAARCQFPLAEEGEIDMQLGSRHRAAMGLSHDCDAMIVVVSEETGIISIAHNGHLKRGFTENSLRDYILDQFADQKKPRGKDRRKQQPAVAKRTDTKAAPQSKNKPAKTRPSTQTTAGAP